MLSKRCRVDEWPVKDMHDGKNQLNSFFLDTLAEYSPETMCVASCVLVPSALEMLMEKGAAGTLSHDPLPEAPLPTLSEVWQGLQLWLVVLSLQTIQLVENDGNNLENVEYSVYIQYILPISIHLSIYLSIHLSSIYLTLISKVVSNHVSVAQCSSMLFTFLTAYPRKDLVTRQPDEGPQIARLLVGTAQRCQV